MKTNIISRLSTALLVASIALVSCSELEDNDHYSNTDSQINNKELKIVNQTSDQYMHSREDLSQMNQLFEAQGIYKISPKMVRERVNGIPFGVVPRACDQGLLAFVDVNAVAGLRWEIAAFGAGRVVATLAYGQYPAEGRRLYPEGLKDGTRLISLWEQKPAVNQDISPKFDARYSVNVYGKGIYVSKGEEIDLTVYSKVYTPEELCRLAQNYYFERNDFYPPNADAKDNGDGTFTICLYESICDDGGNTHTSTCGWYTVDACGMGTDDLTGARVDINP